MKATSNKNLLTSFSLKNSLREVISIYLKNNIHLGTYWFGEIWKILKMRQLRIVSKTILLLEALYVHGEMTRMESKFAYLESLVTKLENENLLTFENTHNQTKQHIKFYP